MPFVGFREIELHLPGKIVCACSRILFMTREKERCSFFMKTHYKLYREMEIADLDPLKDAKSSNFTHKRTFFKKPFL